MTDINATSSDPPVLFLPGLMCDATMFAQTSGPFAATVIDDHYGGADRIDDMATHALTQAPPYFALVGHSMGARVALDVVARAPDRVTRLMLADFGVHAASAQEPDKRHALRDLGRAQGFSALIDAWLPPMVGQSRRGDRDWMHALRAMCLRAGQGIFEAQIEALLHRRDAVHLLANIRCPTMIVVGAQDAWAPVEQHAAIARAIAGAELRVMDDTGHMAPAEDPMAFSRLITLWLTL